MVSHAQTDESKQNRPLVVDSRTADRHSLDVSGAVIERNGDLRHAVEVSNISERGLLFETDWPYDEFDRFLMQLVLEGQYFTTEVMVRHAQSTFGILSVGVEFVSADPELVERIRGLELLAAPVNGGHDRIAVGATR
jgi:hypothetical protein